jgi:hypothetical protein
MLPSIDNAFSALEDENNVGPSHDQPATNLSHYTDLSLLVIVMSLYRRCSYGIPGMISL